MPRLHRRASRSIHTAKPTAEIGSRATEPGEQPVIASAGDQRIAGARRVGQFEHEAGVVIEAAPERGREAHALQIDAARGQEAGAAFEQVDGRRQRFRHVAFAGERAQRGRRLVGLAGNAEEAFDQRAHVARQFGADAKRRLFEEAFRDLGDRAAADRVDAGDRQADR